MLGAQLSMPRVDMFVTVFVPCPRIVCRIGMLVAMDIQPGCLHLSRLIMLSHPCDDVLLCPELRPVIGKFKKQELLCFDAHAAPAQGSRITEFRAVAVGMCALQHLAELVRAECNQDGGKFRRFKIAETQGETELSPRFRRLQRQGAALVARLASESSFHGSPV